MKLTPELKFYPMSVHPRKSEDDINYSDTVLVYSEDMDFSDLGFYHYGDDQWHVLGQDSIKMICWCYLPDPKEFMKDKNWKTATHFGYRD